MWEVVAAADACDDLVSWVCDVALPSVEDEAGCRGGEVYRSADRVVVITHWEAAPRDLPDPPDNLTARAPHAWDFERVSREP